MRVLCQFSGSSCYLHHSTWYLLQHLEHCAALDMGGWIFRSPPVHAVSRCADSKGDWQVVTAAAGSSLSGSCSITATVTFQGGIAPLTASTSVSLVGLSRLAVYALAADVAVVPSPPAATGLITGDDLVLLECTAGRYDQVGHQEPRNRTMNSRQTCCHVHDLPSMPCSSLQGHISQPLG